MEKNEVAEGKQGRDAITMQGQTIAFMSYLIFENTDELLG